MKTITVYKCEFCDYTNGEPEMVKEHEAEHFGLTLDEYNEWKKLNKTAVYEGKRMAIVRCPLTIEQFDKACQKLADFEEKHNLEQKSKPTNFYY